MKLTKSQAKKLRKKLKLKTNAEDLFVSLFLNDVKQGIGKRIRKAKTFEEVEDIISSLDMRNIRKYARRLRNSVLARNNKGVGDIIKIMSQGVQKGLQQVQQKRRASQEFAKEMSQLIRNKNLVNPLLEVFEKNVSLIKNLPQKCCEELRQGYLEGKSFRGTELEKSLYKELGNKAKLIVRTESAKVNTAITEVRTKAVGVKCYLWSTSGDGRVRDTHSMLDNVLVFWNDAPTFSYTTQEGATKKMSGHCGETPNCRCIALPVFELDDLKFPVKVAEHLEINTKTNKGKSKSRVQKGRIQLYTKTDFLKRYGGVFGV